MIKNKKIFAEIYEYKTTGLGKYSIYYKVKFVTEWDVIFLGKVIKHKSETEDVPLLFKNKSVADDYCSIHPYLIEDTFTNTYDHKWVKYHTYRVLQNKKIIGYIKWVDEDVNQTENDNGINFYSNNKLVDMFVEDVLPNSWLHTFTVKNVSFNFPKEYLSHLIQYVYKPKKDIVNHWRYQLVEE